MRVVLLLLIGALLAGCADSTPVAETDDLGKDKVKVDADSGAIRGVVVDQSINPVAGANVFAQGADASLETVTDAEGLFIFNELDPGTYFLTISKQYYTETQKSVVVEAGVEPDLERVQIEELFDQLPYMSREKFEGFFQCAYNAGGVSSTCVNDYSRICDPNDVPVCCAGGCFPELASAVDHREYVTVLEPNWATIQIEMTWESSLAGTSDTMGMTVSYKAREGAGHNWGSPSGSDPLIYKIQAAGTGGTMDEFPGKIPYEGLDDLFVFMAAGSGQVSIGQDFEVFHITSYIAPLPDDYSFVDGDEDPF